VAVVIPMKRVPDLPVEILVGGRLSEIVGQPLRPYSHEAIEFLAELSQRLLANPTIRSYPDLAGFAYWCRKANLQRLVKGWNGQGRRIGRGIAFHIAPGNVPVNFAFSLGIGLLAGNANIVRVSGVRYPQIDIICAEMDRIAKQPGHERVASMTRVILYPHDDAVTAALSESCHARVLWGGDATITHLRAMPVSPRCVDVVFADRYSLCVMDASAVLSAEKETVESLAAGFYNDVFVLDQNACSSPHLVLWRGEEAEVDKAMLRFWGAVEHVLLSKPLFPVMQGLDKYAQLCRVSILLDSCVSVTRHRNLICRVRLKELSSGIEHHKGQYGFFFEAVIKSVESLKTIVGERYQTVTCFGVDPEEIISLVVDTGWTGIDRVVPVGKALDIGVVWDGYNLIESLSRVVADC
jgi:Acyl-CoA reductase (LuxC)